MHIIVTCNNLSNDAYEHAVTVSYKNISFRIARLEHLMAIMIQLQKPKYRERLRVLIEEKTFNETYLNQLLQRFGLTNQWEDLKRDLTGNKP